MERRSLVTQLILVDGLFSIKSKIIFSVRIISDKNV